MVSFKILGKSMVNNMTKKEKSPYPKIDIIRKKFDENKSFSLREACFILWAEKFVCSAQYLMFAYWVKQNKLSKMKFKWDLWYGLFSTFAESYYPKMRDDLPLAVKIGRLGTKVLD